MFPFQLSASAQKLPLTNAELAASHDLLVGFRGVHRRVYGECDVCGEEEALPVYDLYEFGEWFAHYDCVLSASAEPVIREFDLDTYRVGGDDLLSVDVRVRRFGPGPETSHEQRAVFERWCDFVETESDHMEAQAMLEASFSVVSECWWERAEDVWADCRWTVEHNPHATEIVFGKGKRGVERPEAAGRSGGQAVMKAHDFETALAWVLFSEWAKRSVEDIWMEVIEHAYEGSRRP